MDFSEKMCYNKNKNGIRMPSTYAHKVFGDKVLSVLPKSLSEAFSKHLSAYWLGLHGPDLLFYYHPILPNETRRLGSRLHDLPAAGFFLNVREKIRKDAETRRLPAESTDLAAYAAGFLCHFALDSECHGYIGQRIADSGISHTRIETEFDAYLLAKNQEIAIGVNHAAHLKGRTEAARPAAILLGIPESAAKNGLKSFVRINGWLSSANPFLRGVIFSALAVSGKYGELRGMFYDKKPCAACAESNEILEGKLEQAIPVAASLVSEFFEKLSDDRPLSERFGLDYNGNIPEGENASGGGNQ